MFLYLFVFVPVSFYFFFKRRHLDLFLLTHACLILYSSVIFSGKICITSKICHLSIPSDFPISYAIVDFFLFIFAFINDSKRTSVFPLKPIMTNMPKSFNLYLNLLTCTYFSLLFYIVATTPASLLLFSHKSAMTESVGIIFELYVWLGVVFSISLFFCRNPYLKYSFWLISIIVPLILGDRTSPVLSVIGLFFLFCRNLPRRSLFLNIGSVRLVALALCALLFFSSAKAFYSDLRTSNSLSNISDGFERRGLIGYLQSGIELSATNYIFTDIINTQYYDRSHLLESSFLSALPLPRSFITESDSASFGRNYQNRRLRMINFGAAYSILGEFYSLFSIFGIFIFSLLFSSIIFYLNRLFYNTTSPFILLMTASIIGLSCFYIFRNSSSTYFGFLRFVLYPQVALFSLSKILISCRRAFNG